MSSSDFTERDTEDVGTQIQVTDRITVSEETRYAIANPSQGISVCRGLIEDWERGIKNSRIITAHLNGKRPRSPKQLKALARDWLPNINSGELRNQCQKMPSRFFMPVFSASSLSSSRLPSRWPNAANKSEIYRSEVTTAIRRWKKWPWFVKKICREMSFFGFGFAVWFDEVEWKPTFIRQDQGFVPVGTELGDEDVPLFMVRWAYKVPDLIKTVEESREAGHDVWKLEAVAAAINAASTVTSDDSSENQRRYEELVRQAATGELEKGYRVVEAWHLFSVDPDKSVSHHVYLADQGKQKGNQKAETTTENRLLFEKRGQFDSMDDVFCVMAFDGDDGTVHGSWGAGQMIFESSLEYEKTLNDWLGALRQAAKIKTQCQEGVEPSQVKLVVDDAMMLLKGATFAGNTAALISDPEPFTTALEALAEKSRERLGNYIPPIPIKPSDIKAAHVNAKMQEQEERRTEVLQMFLLQFGAIVRNCEKRMNSDMADGDDPIIKDMRKNLEGVLTREENKILADTVTQATIFEFTDIAAAQRAQFAQSKENNPFYNQRNLQLVQTRAVGGQEFSDFVLLPGDDLTVESLARREQGRETATMIQGIPQKVLPVDADWFHMLELRPVLEQVLTSGNVEIGTALAEHYTQHYIGAVAKKSMPKDRINPEKSFIAKVEKFLQTGEIPPEGFEDAPDFIGQVEQAMTQEPVTGPTQETTPDAVGADQAGVEALVGAGG